MRIKKLLESQRLTAPGGWPRPTSIACRNSASASSASCARTFAFAGPSSAREFSARLLVYAAALEMHPLDSADRIPDLKNDKGIGYCNITKCCTKVCPEHITITDNAIIPLKERVVDEFYDPIKKLIQLVVRKRPAPSA